MRSTTPHPPMETNEHNEQRLNDLEIKASYLEDTMDQLDRIIIRQQEQIDLLIRELTHLRQQAPEPGTGRNLRDELPPHY
jgi:SlyX protein